MVRRRVWPGVGLVIGLAACRGATGEGTAATSSDAATSESGNTSAPPTDTTIASTTSGDSGGFVTMPDVGALPQCALYADDCAEGTKCSPYASDGSNTADATRCIPIAPRPAGLGEACNVERWVASGLDDCDRGLYCVVWDVEALVGECVAYCVEDPDEPDLVCTDADSRCIGGPDILPRLCSAGCDPFGADCPGDRNCYRINDHFSCLDDASGRQGAYGDACLFTNECDAGMLCADPPEFFECGNDQGCCTPFCDTRDPEASASCPGAPEHMCVPLFDPGEGPPLYDWVGACVVPTKGGP